MRRSTGSARKPATTLSHYLPQTKNIAKRNSLLSSKNGGKIMDSPGLLGMKKTKLSHKASPVVEEEKENLNTRLGLSMKSPATPDAKKVEAKPVHEVPTEKEEIPTASDFPVIESKLNSPRVDKSSQEEEQVEIHDPRQSIRSSHTPPSTSQKIILKSGSSAPAHARFRELATKSTSTSDKLSTDLLPASYLHLELIFNALENVLRFMSSRDQKPIYHKIRKAVEMQAGRVFELEHLQQILYLWPEAFVIEPVQTIFEGTRVHSYLIQISEPATTNDPLDNKSASSSTNNSPRKRSFATMESQEKLKQTASFKDLVHSMSTVKQRRLHFHDLLVDQVRSVHENFLKENKKSDFANNKPLTKWHPDFELESVPTIPLFELPAPVMSYLDKLKLRAKEKLLNDKTRDAELLSGRSTPTPVFQGIPGILVPSSSPPASPGSVTSLLSPSTPSSIITTDKPSTPSSSTTPPASRASKILERIREKQRLKEELERSKPKPFLDLHKRSMLKKVPEMAQSVCFCFRSQKKSSLPLAKVIDYLKSDTKNATLSKHDVLDIVFFISILFPDFYKIGDLDHLIHSPNPTPTCEKEVDSSLTDINRSAPSKKNQDTLGNVHSSSDEPLAVEQVTTLLRGAFSSLESLKAQHRIHDPMHNPRKYVKLFAQDSLAVQAKAKQMITLLS